MFLREKRFKMKPYMYVGVNQRAEVRKVVKTENRLQCIIYLRPYKDYSHLTDQNLKFRIIQLTHKQQCWDWTPSQTSNPRPLHTQITHTLLSPSICYALRFIILHITGGIIGNFTVTRNTFPSLFTCSSLTYLSHLSCHHIFMSI